MLRRESPTMIDLYITLPHLLGLILFVAGCVNLAFIRVGGVALRSRVWTYDTSTGKFSNQRSTYTMDRTPIYKTVLD